MGAGSSRCTSAPSVSATAGGLKETGQSFQLPPAAPPSGPLPESKVPEDLAQGLRASPKVVPVRYLYDSTGSQLYQQITELDEYYPYRAELQLLAAHAGEIVGHIPPGSIVVELGVGAAEKTSLLLQALLDRDGCEAVQFCGIDCSAEALRQARDNLRLRCPQLPDTSVTLLEADYLAGVAEVRRQHPDAMLFLLWLGSSVGNFGQDAAAGFLHDLASMAGEHSQLLLCCDMWKDVGTLQAAYNDAQGVTEAFIKNGMRHALLSLGHGAAANADKWEYEVVVNQRLQQVEMFLTAKSAVPQVLPGVDIAAGEQVLMEVSRKFTHQAVADMAYRAGQLIQANWGGPDYRMYLLLPPQEALLRCWADTDSLFGSITDWNAQPIGLRHPFCFYYGHLAAFARLKVLPQDKDTALDITLSRGVDPNVLDPSKCHLHPAIPATWPSQQHLLEYVAEVRTRLLRSMGAGAPGPMHALCMSLEHERMHQETLCYMLAQQRKLDFMAATKQQGQAAGSDSSMEGTSVGQPAAQVISVASEPAVAAGTGVQPFYLQQCSYLSTSAAGRPVGGNPPFCIAAALPARDEGDGQEGEGGSTGENGTVEKFRAVPATTVELGLGVDAGCGFVWDNELGREGPLQVAPFLLAPAPVTVAQFHQFVLAKGYQRPELWDGEDWQWVASCGVTMPATWSEGPDGFWVHMPEGSFPWQQVADCPAYVSLAEALAYCRLHGARVMTEAEHAAACQHCNGSPGGAGIVGLCEGGWEWCATPLAPFPGSQPDPLYPEYSADFFKGGGSGRHYVLKGNSPYTHPSVRRDSFRNYYQRQYPYVFAKFRLAQDGE